MKTQTTGSARKRTEIGERLHAALQVLGFGGTSLDTFMNRCSVADNNAKPTMLCRDHATGVLFGTIGRIGSREQEREKFETDLMVGARVVGAVLGRTIMVTSGGDLLIGHNPERAQRMARIRKAEERKQKNREALEASRTQGSVAA